ncbi:UNVERIFIED_CONTAM: Ubiquitin domain-containing protein ubfd1 [Siphonaria sp. JEL0065]|nr:Ubiquitin domain-containing protein ubfd1 [Siphonaria sp. JEL0065]
MSIPFKVSYKTQVLEFELAPTATVSELKKLIENETQIDVGLQKLLFKGILKDEQTIEEAKIGTNSKVMLMASSAKDILQVVTPPVTSSSGLGLDPAAALAAKPSIFTETEHAKIIKRGKPDFEIEKGLTTGRANLPPLGVTVLNQRGLKTRLSFRSESQELQIATAERTQKIAFSSCARIQSEDMPAESGGEGYVALGIQIGPTEKSTLWFYWLPKQYVENIKDAVLGQFPAAQYLLNQILNSNS